MDVLGTALIIAGVILLSWSIVLRWSRKPSSSTQNNAQTRLFRLNEEMQNEEAEQASEQDPALSRGFPTTENRSSAVRNTDLESPVPRHQMPPLPRLLDSSNQKDDE